MDFLTSDEKWLLALYLKQMTFEDVLRRYDVDDKENMKDQTYEMLGVVGKVQKRLAAEGFSPR